MDSGSEGDNLGRIPVPADQVHQFGGFQPDGGGVVIGVDADDPRLLQEVLIQIEGDPAGGVMQQAQGCHSAGRESQQVQQLLDRKSVV